MNENTLNLDEYGQLLQKIQSYYRKEDIEFTEDVISVYDLYQLLLKRLEPLKSLKKDKSLVEKINKNNKKITNLFKKNDWCQFVTFSNNDRTSTISVGFSKPNGGSFADYTIRIKKDHNSDEIYFENKVNKEIVVQNYDYIMNVFAILEDGQKLFNSPSITDSAKRLHVDDDFFDIGIMCAADGDAGIRIEIKGSADPNHIYYREWLKRQSLVAYVHDNQQTIIKKVPIEVSKLNGIFKKIVEEELSKTKEPVLMKNR